MCLIMLQQTNQLHGVLARPHHHGTGQHPGIHTATIMQTRLSLLSSKDWFHQTELQDTHGLRLTTFSCHQVASNPPKQQSPWRKFATGQPSPPRPPSSHKFVSRIQITLVLSRIRWSSAEIGRAHQSIVLGVAVNQVALW